MLRYLAGVVSALLLVGAGVFLFRSSASTEAPPIPPPGRALVADPQSDEEDTPLPAATKLTREQKRFNRYDKDRDGQILREEYLASRRKAYAKLDTNGDGRLSFDEWAITTIKKFAEADKDRSGAMNAAEFATTAVKPSTPTPPKCPPQRVPNDAD